MDSEALADNGCDSDKLFDLDSGERAEQSRERGSS